MPLAATATANDAGVISVAAQPFLLDESPSCRESTDLDPVPIAFTLAAPRNSTIAGVVIKPVVVGVSQPHPPSTPIFIQDTRVTCKDPATASVPACSVDGNLDVVGAKITGKVYGLQPGAAVVSVTLASDGDQAPGVLTYTFTVLGRAPTPTGSVGPASTFSPTPVNTREPTATPAAATPTLTSTPAVSHASTPSQTPTGPTSTPSNTSTASPTATSSPTPTLTPTGPTATNTATLKSSPTPTSSPSGSRVSTPTMTPTATQKTAQANVVSVSRGGDGPSNGVAVNQDGAYVAFFSDATNLVPGDTNGVRDVFVRGRTAGAVERVSVGSAGEQANRASHAQGGAPAITGDGKIVAFYSEAFNLVDGDTNEQADVFVRLLGHGTQRVSVDSNGTEANGASILPSISQDGRVVAFQSHATNLVADDTNGVTDVFVRDRIAQRTLRVCGGIEGNGFSVTPAISADGNVVAFASAATNLVAHDTNRFIDVFVCDLRNGALEIISVSSAGKQGNGDSILPAISEDGRFVAFKSTADNLVANDNNQVVDVFVRDRLAGTTERVSVDVKEGDANDASFPPSISHDGRFVAFGSAANDLVVDDYNNVASVFVRDRLSAGTALVDVSDSGRQANAGTPDVVASVSGDGRFVGFVSSASNLVANDRNETLDVFIKGNPFALP